MGRRGVSESNISAHGERVLIRVPILQRIPDVLARGRGHGRRHPTGRRPSPSWTRGRQSQGPRTPSDASNVQPLQLDQSRQMGHVREGLSRSSLTRAHIRKLSAPFCASATGCTGCPYRGPAAALELASPTDACKAAQVACQPRQGPQVSHDRSATAPGTGHLLPQHDAFCRQFHVRLQRRQKTSFTSRTQRLERFLGRRPRPSFTLGDRLRASRFSGLPAPEHVRLVVRSLARQPALPGCRAAGGVHKVQYPAVRVAEGPAGVPVCQGRWNNRAHTRATC